MTRWLVLTGCLALAALTACGRKAPLYLPDKTGTVVTRPGGAAPAPTDDSSSKEEDEKPK